MSDQLARSSAQAAQVSGQALPYVAQGADFGTPLVRGFAAGQQMAGQAQELALRAAAEEREQRTYAQRAMMFEAELRLRGQQAATQAAEAQTQLFRAQSEQQLIGLREEADRRAGVLAGAELLERLTGSNVFYEGGGRYSIYTVGVDGLPAFLKGLSQDHPEVKAALARRDAHTLRREADRDVLKARAENLRQPPTPRADSERLPTLESFQEDEKFLMGQLTGLQDEFRKEPTPQLKAEIERVTSDLETTRRNASQLRLRLSGKLAGSEGSGAPAVNPQARASRSLDLMRMRFGTDSDDPLVMAMNSTVERMGDKLPRDTFLKALVAIEDSQSSTAKSFEEAAQMSSDALEEILANLNSSDESVRDATIDLLQQLGNR